MGRDSYSFRLTVEECQSISTVYLNQNNFLNGGMHIVNLTWNRWGEKRGSVGLQVSTLDKFVRFYYTQTDRFSGQKTDLNYVVKLVSTPCYFGGHRWWFICPIVSNGKACNRRVGVLYMGRGEYFGCRHCYNLTYKCQKERGKYDRYFERLGWDPKVARNVLKYMSKRRKFCKTKNT
jgi:hypothetical protein